MIYQTYSSKIDNDFSFCLFSVLTDLGKKCISLHAHFQLKEDHIVSHTCTTCFCGCVGCVVEICVLSRVPRVRSLPTEVIIYSIYKTMYVQNRKSEKEKKKPPKTWVKAGSWFNTQKIYKQSSLNLSCLYYKLYTGTEKAPLIHYYWIYRSVYSKGGNAVDKKHFCQLIGICLDLYFQATYKSHNFFQLF